MSADFDRIDQAARKSRASSLSDSTLADAVERPRCPTVVLQQYGLTSLNPSRWEDVQGEETAELGLDGDGLAGSSKEMDDPLGLRNKLAM